MTELKMNRAAFALIKDSAHRVLLVQSLTNVLYAGQWSLPGGVVEDGESLQTGAQREVMEEVGIVCTINQQIRQIVNTVNDNITVTTFAADYVSGEIVLQDEEIADARWFTLEETKELEIGFNIRELL